MKAGEVVSIRVNPEDVMSCIDICLVAGIYVKGMSLAQVVRTALSGLLEGARTGNVVPHRDGFEYSEMIAKFIVPGHDVRKLQISNVIEQAEVARGNVGLPRSPMAIGMMQHAPAIITEDTPDVKRLKANLIRRQMELDSKKQADPDNFSTAEQEELTRAVQDYAVLLKG